MRGNMKSFIIPALFVLATYVGSANQTAYGQAHEAFHLIQSPIQLVDFDGDEVRDGIFGSIALASSNGQAIGWALAVSGLGVLIACYNQSQQLDAGPDTFRLQGLATFIPFGGQALDERELVIFVRPTLEIDECLIWDLTADGGGSTSFLTSGSIFRIR